MTAFHVSALPAADLDRVRARGTDDFGNPIVITTNTEEGSPPLRCCLQEARVGEQVALIAYRPSAIPGAYAEVGPVFVHAERCAGWTGSGYPDAYRPRRQLLRAYDHAGRQVDNVLVESGEAEASITRLLSRPEIAFLHSRNPMAGCWMFSIDRPLTENDAPTLEPWSQYDRATAPDD